MRYLMTFSYDGSYFNGYQKQKNLLSVQEELEKVLTSIANGKKIIIHSTGRTDKGVHAINQKAHFDMDVDITLKKLKMALNSYTSKALYVKDIVVVDSKFHARYMVKNKEYLYIINMGEYNPIEVNYVYQYNKSLCVKEIKEACKYFIGKHNFKSFTSSEDIRENYNREIFNISVKECDNKVYITIVGNGFLKYQIRNMIGTLIKVGEKERLPVDIIDIINKENRIHADETAPACGLYLKNVSFKENL